MIDVSRRSLLAWMGGLTALGLAPGWAEDAPERAGMTLGAPTPFDPELVVSRARALAAAAHVPPPAVSQDWLDLSYDDFRGIWFDTRHTLFRGTPGAVQAEFFVAGPHFPPHVRPTADRQRPAPPI